MSNLLTTQFWFSPKPTPLIASMESAFIALIVTLVIIGIVFSLLKRKEKLFEKVFTEIYYFGFTNAFIGLVILFFNLEEIQFFSARFWFILWGIEMVIWIFYIVKKGIKIPKDKRTRNQKKEYNKYMPR